MNIASHMSQPEIAARVAKREIGVTNTEATENCGVQIAHTDRVCAAAG